MAAWGRNAAIGDSGPPQTRYGRWSILLALLAPCAVIAAFIVLENLPEGAADDVKGFFSGMTVVVFAIVAPLLHFTGIGFGVAGLTRARNGKASSVVGILLNVALFASGVGIVYFAAGALTAFR